MIRNKLIFILVLVLLIVGGITFFKKNAAPVSNDLGIPIKVIIAETGGLTKGINYTGTIESVNSAPVSSKLTSEVIEKTIQEGDLVKKGDIIARLDNRNLVALLDSTMKKIDTLGVNYTYLSDEADKYKILLDNEAVAKSAYDKVKHEADMVSLQIEEAKASSEATYNQLKSQRDSTGAQLKELEAKVNELNISIADASILAPIAGKVRTTFYQVGDLAAGGKPFAVIDATDGYRIKVDVSEQDLGKISVGSKVILNITGVIDGIDARVTKVLPSVNSKTRVGEVEIAITELGGKDIVTGTSAEVKFVTDELKDGIVITRTAIKSLKDSVFVYVINDGVAHEQKIKTGLVVDDSVQVIEGLNAGAAIAGNNLTRLYDGVKVYVSEGGGKR